MSATRGARRAWIHQAVPALGGRTPLEAAKERSLCPRVEALVKAQEHRAPADPEHAAWLRSALGLEDAGAWVNAKMSDTVLDFADPILGLVEVEDYPHVFNLALLAWNAGLKVDLLPQAESLLTSDLDREHFAMLLERKRTLFAADRRFLGDVGCVLDGGELKVFAKCLRE